MSHVHLKDVDAAVAARVRAGEITYMQGVQADMYVALGDGDVPVADIVAVLEAAGFTGWYVLEQDTTHKHPRDAAAINLRYIQGLTA